jgi:hypothetical protein
LRMSPTSCAKSSRSASLYSSGLSRFTATFMRLVEPGGWYLREWSWLHSHATTAKSVQGVMWETGELSLKARHAGLWLRV